MVYRNDEIVPEDDFDDFNINRGEQRTSIIDASDWQEQIGWGNHLVDQTQRITFEDY